MDRPDDRDDPMSGGAPPAGPRDGREGPESGSGSGGERGAGGGRGSDGGQESSGREGSGGGQGSGGTAAEAGERAPTAGAPESRLQQWKQAGATFLGLVRKAPLTLSFLAALWIVAVATGSLAHGPSDRLLDDIAAGTASFTSGQVWNLVSYAFWCTNFWAYVGTTVLALAVLVPAERRLGAWRTAGLFALCQIAGAALGIAAIEIGSTAGDIWLQDSVDLPAVGPSVGIVGVGLALSADLTALWRRRTRVLLITATLLFAFYAGDVLDIFRLGGAVVGFVAGILLVRRGTGFRLASSHAETRVLVALFAATSALGPVVTWITDTEFGPLAVFVNLFIDEAPTPSEMSAACGGGPGPANAGLCRELRADQLLSGSPSVLILLVPMLLLAVMAIGLWRGRRMAWWAVLIFEVGLAAATFRSSAQLLTQIRSEPDSKELITAVYVYGGLLMLVPVLVIVVLLLTRRHFDLRAPRWTGWKLLGIAVLALVVIGAIYITFGYDLRNQFDPVPSFNDFVVDYPKRLVPPTYLALFDTNGADFIPQGGAAKALYVLVGPVFWLVVLGGLLLTFWRSNLRSKDGTAARAEALLLRYGGSTLAYMTTWPGNSHWISPDGQAAVAYRVVGTIALTMGDPYGAAGSRAPAVAEFTAFCDSQGWSPCFYSVTDEAEKAADALGWSSVQVAEDTLLPLADLAFTGKKWQDVRTALNKAGKAGITAKWYTFPTAPLAVQEQVRALSEEWVADKGLPEMGFTLGGLGELDDPRVRCLVALDADGALHGITSWLPSFRDGEPVGWTLDFMRRGAEGFRGVMEFLIASAALGFKEEGAEFLSLSGAPLARIDRGSQPAPLQRLLDVAGQSLEPVYGFRSLLAFKAKFQPQYHPLYMSYPDPAALPAIGTAIGRAYLPHTTPAQMVRLSRKLMG